jgi:hypothetical protein
MSDIPSSVLSNDQDYFLFEDGNRTGPLKAIEVWSKIKTNKIRKDALAWTKDLGEWKRIDDPFWGNHGIQLITPDSGFKTASNIDKPEITLKNKEVYFQILELGLWERLLKRIGEQNALEQIEDIKFLKQLSSRINSLSTRLNQKEIIRGSPLDFISSEYMDFDSDAEKVESQIIDICRRIRSNEFWEDLLTPSSDPLRIITSLENEVVNLCKEFKERNGHRIFANDDLNVWSVYSENFGENEDMPLINGLLEIAINDIDEIRKIIIAKKVIQEQVIKKTASISINSVNLNRSRDKVIAAVSITIAHSALYLTELFRELFDEKGSLITGNFIVVNKIISHFNQILPTESKKELKIENLIKDKRMLLKQSNFSFLSTWEKRNSNKFKVSKDDHFYIMALSQAKTERKRLFELKKQVDKYKNLDAQFAEILNQTIDNHLRSAQKAIHEIEFNLKPKLEDRIKRKQNKDEPIKPGAFFWLFYFFLALAGTIVVLIFYFDGLL